MADELVGTPTFMRKIEVLLVVTSIVWNCGSVAGVSVSKRYVSLHVCISIPHSFKIQLLPSP